MLWITSAPICAKQQGRKFYSAYKPHSWEAPQSHQIVIYYSC